MAFSRYNGTVQDDKGNAIVGARIEVRNEETGFLARLYSDRDGVTPLGNPFTATDANFFFHVVGGNYRIIARSQGFEKTWRWEAIGTIQAFDLEDLSIAFGVGNVPARTLAELNTYLPLSDAPLAGTVYADPTVANNGHYTYNHSTEQWVWARPLPDTLSSLEVTGGTVNDVIAASYPGIDPSHVRAFYLYIPDDRVNTGPVTLNYGAGAIPVFAADGVTPLAAGDWIGSILLDNRDDHLVIVSPGQAYARQAQEYAEEARLERVAAGGFAIEASGHAAESETQADRSLSEKLAATSQRELAEAAATISSQAADVSILARDAAIAASEASGDVRFFFSYADAEAELPSLPDQQIVSVSPDETRGGLRALYRVEGGALVFKYASGDLDVPVDMLGADEDYAAALTAAIAITDQMGGFVTHKPGKRYFTREQVTVTDRHVRIRMNGAQVLRATDAPNGDGILYAWFSFTEVQTVSEIASVNRAINGASSASTVSRITVTDGSAYQPGDTVKIFSDDVIPWGVPADAEKCGEIVEINFVSGNNLFTVRPLRVPMATNVRIAKLTKKDVILRDLYIGDELGSPLTRNARMVVIIGAVRPKAYDLRAEDCLSEAFVFNSCYAPEVHNAQGRKIRTSSPDAAYGYLVVDHGCSDGYYTGLRGTELRHVITSRANAPADMSDDIHQYGGSVGAVVEGGSCFETEHSGWDTHGDAYMWSFISCESHNNFRGYLAGQASFNLRGAKHLIKDCVSEGPGGLVATMENDWGDHIIEGFVHRTPQGLTQPLGIFSFTNNGPGRARVSLSAKVEFSGVGTVMTLTNVDLTSPEFVADYENFSAGLVSPVTLTNSKAYFGRFLIDATKSTSLDQRIFGFFAGSISEVLVSYLRAVYAGKTYRFANLVNSGGRAIIEYASVDTLPNTFNGGFVNTSGSEEYWVGTVEFNGRVTRELTEQLTNANKTLNAFSGETQILDVALTAARTITLPTSGISPGKELTFIRTSSATGSVLNIGALTSLPDAGSWVRIKYQGLGQWAAIGRGYMDSPPPAVGRGYSNMSQLPPASSVANGSIAYVSSGFGGRRGLAVAWNNVWYIAQLPTEANDQAQFGEVRGDALVPTIYTVATLPDVSQFNPGAIIRVSNGYGGLACLAISDGTDWHALPIQDPVSTTLMGVARADAFRPGTYTATTLPSASEFGLGAIIRVSNGWNGVACLAMSDGTQWICIPPGRVGPNTVRSEFHSDVIRVGSYTVATVPVAGGMGAGALIRVSNGDSGAACLAISDGTNWRRIPMGAIISAS